VRREGIPFSSRHRIIDTAGDIHVVVVVGDRWYAADDGEMVGTVGFYVDITDEFNADVRHCLDKVVATITARRPVINQAIGMLLLAYSVPADRAFEILAWRSQETNVKLRDIAMRLVEQMTAASLLSSDRASQFDHMLLTVDQPMSDTEPRDLTG
jgi:hypothetical protein